MAEPDLAPCYNCGEATDTDDLCPGCHERICPACDQLVVFGSHFPDQHLDPLLLDDSYSIDL